MNRLFETASFTLCAATDVTSIGSGGAWIWIAAAGLLMVSLLLCLPHGRISGRGRRALAATTGFGGLGFLWFLLPRLELGLQAAFVGFGLLAVIAAVATISSRSPVYSAIWFAISLLGVAGLLMIQGAQFLGIATVAVYAGAIVVTFLFVLMLAQPEGLSFYDRISWGGITPRFVASFAATFFVVLIGMAVTQVEPETLAVRQRVSQLAEAHVEAHGAKLRSLHFRRLSDGHRIAVPTISIVASGETRTTTLQALELKSDALVEKLNQLDETSPVSKIEYEVTDLLSQDHTAHLGAQLFGRHLIAVQAAGALLLAALVGAVAIAARGGEHDENKRLAGNGLR